MAILLSLQGDSAEGVNIALREYYSVDHYLPNRVLESLLKHGRGRLPVYGHRHAYATHLLEAGLPVHRLQRLMGHQSLQSTLRYVHWVPSYREGEGDLDLIAKLEGMDHD